MARGKKAVNGGDSAAAVDSPSDSTPTPPPRSILPITPTPSKDRDVVKVNNANLTELKNALDDAIKRVRNIFFFLCTIALTQNLLVPLPARPFQTNTSSH
jgi:hypothetical protein